MLARTQLYDNHGPYTKLQRVFRPAIDSSFLRASKKIYSIGNRLLYEKNPFIFKMRNQSSHGCPPTALLKPEYDGVEAGAAGTERVYLSQKYQEFHPCSTRPYQCPPEFRTQIDAAILNIERRAPLAELQGWAYYDGFLHFLHTIGPKNAASLKTVMFTGIIKLHECQDENCSRCDDELIETLGLYLPIIKAVCKTVEKIVVYAQKDYNHRPYISDLELSINWERALLPFLKNGFREIASLRVLEVYCAGDDRDCTKLAEICLPTVRFLQERTAQRIRERVQNCLPVPKKQGLMRHGQTSSNSCEFCGESHVWPVCPNLCNFCGRFGHFRKECATRPFLSWEFQEPY